jgi:hypothetical protein
MKPTVLLGVASAIMSKKKYKIIFVGLQFGYLTYKLLQRRKAKKQNLKQIH